ncbi:MAG TPA: 30S ribosomal protein S2 [Spirochaetota bacterium]|nr:30S ribosomal protein S2 [Spirochaetota bacterium]
MAVITMKELLESGVHFGHQTRRWNPKMQQFIFTSRNGIHIIDLQKTMQRLKATYSIMKDLSEKGGKILFVGTKKQARGAVKEYAEKCGMYYVSERWLGGLLTNYKTVSQSIKRLKSLQRMRDNDDWDAETKKERLELQRELEKKEKFLSGIADMDKLPDALFVVDPKREQIAVNEAHKLNIPIFAVVDTNCNPEEVDYPIPGNDDAIRAIALFLRVMVDAIEEGRSGGMSAVEDDSDMDDDNAEASSSDSEESEVAEVSVEDTKE